MRHFLREVPHVSLETHVDRVLAADLSAADRRAEQDIRAVGRGPSATGVYRVGNFDHDGNPLAYDDPYLAREAKLLHPKCDTIRKQAVIPVAPFRLP